MESVLDQIEYYQDKLDFLESPLLNPKIYYINSKWGTKNTT